MLNYIGVRSKKNMNLTYFILKISMMQAAKTDKKPGLCLAWAWNQKS